MAERAVPSIDSPPALATLRQLQQDAATGILRLRSVLATDVDVYFMNGAVIAASTLPDDWLLARLLVAGGALDEAALRTVAADLGDGPLPDSLLEQDLLSVDVLHKNQEECFCDNVVHACVTPWESAVFGAEDAVFPPDMQLGVDTENFLDEIAAWYDRTRSLLGILRRPADPLLARTNAPVSTVREHAAIAALCQGEVHLSLVIARSPLVPFRTILVVAQLIAAGSVSIATDDDESEDDGVVGSPSQEADDTLTSSHIEPLTLSQDVTLESPRKGQTEDGDIDYEHVAAGGHAKVYDVLDKVDLSHVDAFPEQMIEAEDEEDLVIAAAEESIEIGGEEVFGLADSEDSEDMQVEIDSAEHTPDDDSSYDAPPIHLSGTEEAFELSIDDEDPINTGRPAATARPVEGKVPEGLPTDLPFSPEQVRSFDRRIGVFNQIFRVVFETFRPVLGDDAVRQRFDRFLQDESLQYPNLFTQISVADDGTLDPSPLIRNLADEDPMDAESYLHQGLYELIYVHLYDAKDMLAPDEEQSMMDQISGYEEQLHR